MLAIATAPNPTSALLVPDLDKLQSTEVTPTQDVLATPRRASAVLANLASANVQAFQANQALNQALLAEVEREPVICVVGVGYVGHNLLTEFGHVFPAIGFDISSSRLSDIKSDFASCPKVRLTSDMAMLKEATHFCISVPTLLREDRSVNTDHLQNAIKMVTTHARPGSTIIIESSVSVGTTRALLGPYSKTFFCGMSPERVDPGRTVPAAHDISKIISALDEKALHHIEKVYSKAFRTVVPVSKPEVAEMTKLFENCYRMINIAYVNEIADACKKQDIDVQELVGAAATKPFGFQSFQPGLGVGGHCIPVNPFYLMANNELPLLRQATETTCARPRVEARAFFDEYKVQIGRAPRVLVVGMGFKPGQSVIDCSPAVDFADELKGLGCGDLAFYDPLVQQEQLPWIRKLTDHGFAAVKLDIEFDAVAVCVKQERVDWSVLDNVDSAAIRWYTKK
jgi:nucleotide sugar dehydrogenase